MSDEHEFTEDPGDYSMCLCGISAVDHELASAAAVGGSCDTPRKDSNK